MGKNNKISYVNDPFLDINSIYQQKKMVLRTLLTHHNILHTGLNRHKFSRFIFCVLCDCYELVVATAVNVVHDFDP